MKKGNGNIGQLLAIGELDNRVTLRQAHTTIDSFGQAVEEWLDEAEVLAKVSWSATGESEKESGGKTTVFQLVQFDIRHRSDVAETWRVAFGGDEFDIVSIAILGRNRFLSISAQKRK